MVQSHVITCLACNQIFTSMLTPFDVFDLDPCLMVVHSAVHGSLSLSLSLSLIFLEE